ncbi:Translation initiation factor 3 subunit J component [Recurvomyces mirabilis]|nr:Translation initiation factor 3 subunit J component [Recurvomyces mirabilis]
MAPSKAPATSWSDEDSDSSASDAPAVSAPVVRRGRFEDEEEEEVLDDWEEEEDSEAEREKAKKAAAVKAADEAKAKAAKKSKSQRIEEHIEEKRKQKDSLLELDSDDEDDDDATRRARARASEKEADLEVAGDLFGGVGGVNPNRAAKPVTVLSDADPGNALDLSTLPLFSPTTPQQFHDLRETLTRLLTANAKKPQYALFLPEFTKALCAGLNAEQVRKIGAGLNTLSNEKMKEEKAAEKGGKKSKAAKTKTSLVANRDVGRNADTALYDDGGLDE